MGRLTGSKDCQRTLQALTPAFFKDIMHSLDSSLRKHREMLIAGYTDRLRTRSRSSGVSTPGPGAWSVM